MDSDHRKEVVRHRAQSPEWDFEDFDGGRLDFNLAQRGL